MDPPPPAALPDELTEEILLRIPPSDPVTLARAAVAQKRWCRLVASRSFRRRYRAHHRTAPMLGFFCDPDDDGSSEFVPTSSFRRADLRHLRPEDARHGRVLLRAHYPHGRILFGGATTWRPDPAITPVFRLVVWDPVTCLRVPLSRPRGFCDDWDWKATVHCAADGSCDHIGCHRGHFTVVLIGCDDARGMLSCVYSSRRRKWSEILFAPHLRAYFGLFAPHRPFSFSAHVGNALYCMKGGLGNKILKYDLGTREFSVMEPPAMLSHDEFQFIGSDACQLTTMEDGQLGLAVLRQSTLYILSTDEEFGWGGTKIIDLEKCGNHVPSTTRNSVIGFVGDIGLVFIKTENSGILSVNIKSAQVKVLDKRPRISWIVPYINFCFCTPAMGVPSKDDQPRAGASRDVQTCAASNLLRQGEIW